MVARPDGRSWSGILHNFDTEGFSLENSNQMTQLSYARNKTASFCILTPPKWELGFGERRLDL